MKSIKTVASGLWVVISIFLFTLSPFFPFSLSSSSAQEADLTLRSPVKLEELNNSDENIPSPIEVKTLPDFPIKINKNIPVQLNTRLRLIVDSYIDSKKAKTGDYFKAHVLDDFYLPSPLPLPLEPPQLIVPKGSWVRGRISYLKRPIIFSKTGKMKIHLDHLTTPSGEITPLNAELNVIQGVENEDENGQGFLMPLHYDQSKTPLSEQEQSSLGGVDLSGGNGNLLRSIVQYLLNGSLIALVPLEDNINFIKGQELQVVLKKEINTLNQQ